MKRKYTLTIQAILLVLQIVFTVLCFTIWINIIGLVFLNVIFTLVILLLTDISEDD